MAPIRRSKQSKSNGGKRATLSNLADVVDDLDLSTSPRFPQAAWVTPGRRRFQLEDESDTDTGSYPQRRAPPTPARRGVGPRGPKPANARSSWADREPPPQFRPSVFQERAPPAANNAPRKSAPRFRLSMFQAPNQPADNTAYAATPDYHDEFARTDTRGLRRQRDQPPPQASDVWALAAHERAAQIEQQIIGFLAGRPLARGNPPLRSGAVPPVPQKFREKVLRAADRGNMKPAVRDYYLDVRRNDVRGIPGQDGEPSLVEEILARDADERLRGRQGMGWRPTRTLGTGGQGKVILWEKHREGGEVRLPVLPF